MSTLELSDLLIEMVENPMLEEVPTEDLQPGLSRRRQGKARPRAAEEQDRYLGRPGLRSSFFGDYLDDGYRPSHLRGQGNSPIENTLSIELPRGPPHVAAVDADRRSADVKLAPPSSAISTTTAPWWRRLKIASMGPWPVADVERALRLVRGLIRPASRPATFRSVSAPAKPPRSGKHADREDRHRHLRLLQNHQVPEIARKMGMSIEDLKEHRGHSPSRSEAGKPLQPSQSQHVIPDVYVVKVEDRHVAMLNEDGLPQMRISPVYRRLLDKNGENTDETRLREGTNSGLRSG